MPDFFTLSLSLQVGIVAAFVAMTVTLRRRVAGAWTLYWVIRLTSGAIVVPIVNATPAHPLSEPRLWGAAASWITGITLYVLLRAVWEQFEPGSAWRPAKRLALAFMLPFALLPLTVQAGQASAADFAWYAIYARVGDLPTDIVLLLVAAAFRRRTDRAAAALLIAGFATYVIRDIASAVYIVPRFGTVAVLASPPFLNAVQLAAVVLVALGALFAVLAEEREAMRQLAAELERGRTYEMLGRMASGVAHDFNNLLSVVGLSVAGHAEGAGEVVLRGRAVQAIEDAVDQGREMVASLMAYARQGATTTPVRFDLHELIRSHEAPLSRLVPDTQTVTFSLASETCPLRGDPTGMVRLLNNLVANARDAMPNGGQVTIATAIHAGRNGGRSTARRSVARAYVSLTVSDEGGGIPVDALSRIFDPFFTTKAASKGTGLGLALAQAFVRGSGGQIRVRESTPRGTTFEVVLPLSP